MGERQRDPFPIRREAIGEEPAPGLVAAGDIETEVFDDRDRLVERPRGLGGTAPGHGEPTGRGERAPPHVGKLHGAGQLLGLVRRV